MSKLYPIGIVDRLCFKHKVPIQAGLPEQHLKRFIEQKYIPELRDYEYASTTAPSYDPNLREELVMIMLEVLDGERCDQ